MPPLNSTTSRSYPGCVPTRTSVIVALEDVPPCAGRQATGEGEGEVAAVGDGEGDGDGDGDGDAAADGVADAAGELSAVPFGVAAPHAVARTTAATIESLRSKVIMVRPLSSATRGSWTGSPSPWREGRAPAPPSRGKRSGVPRPATSKMPEAGARTLRAPRPDRRRKAPRRRPSPSRARRPSRPWRGWPSRGCRHDAGG